MEDEPKLGIGARSLHGWLPSLAITLEATIRNTAPAARRQFSAIVAGVRPEATSEPGAPGAEPRPRLRPFIAVAGILVALFFVDAASGRVLSQADILLRFSPWIESGPPGAVATNGQRPGNLLLGDIPLFFYPSLQLTRDSLRAFRLPVWNPDMYGGQPFLASYQTAVLSPFVVLSILLPPADALLAHAIVRLLVGGAGMFLFLRGLGLAPAAVWFGALTFLLNPFTVVWLEHPLSAVSCWLPWLLWSVDRARRDSGPGNVALLAAVTALTLLAGHPETAFKVLLMTGAYAIALAFVGTHRGRLRSDCTLLFGRLLPAVVLGAAVAAAQIVPFLEYMGESGIAAMRRTFTVSPMVVPPPAAVAAFVPDVFGNPSRGAWMNNYFEQVAYPGNVAWILAAVSLGVAARRWRVAFLAGTALVAAALMYGVPGVSRLFALIPMAGLAAPSRFGLLTIFSVVAMASIGLSAMCESDRARHAESGRGRALRAALTGLAVMTAVVVALIGWQWPMFRQAAFVREMALATASSGAIASIAAALVAGWAKGVVAPRLAVALLIVVSVGDLFAIGFRFHPMLPRAHVLPPLPSIEAIKADRGLFRVAGVGDSLPPNTAMAYGLNDPRGYDGVAPRRYTDLLGRAFGPAMAHRIDQHGAVPVVDLLNVKYLVGNGVDRAPVPHWVPIMTAPVAVYRNDRVFPRAWLVDRVVVRDDASTLDWMVDATSDLRHEAPIAEPLHAGLSPERAAAGGAGEVAISRYEPATVELTTRATGRRLLVLADAWYPGWEVYIDGRQADIVRAYYALRAVPVPAGRHVVRFSYEPASLRIGMAVSAIALIAWGALIVVGVRRR
jgi:hypothetical protein